MKGFLLCLLRHYSCACSDVWCRLDHERGPIIRCATLVVQRLSGQRFDEYLQEHIFQPLQMNDTFFAVPADEAGRFLENHYLDPYRDHWNSDPNHIFAPIYPEGHHRRYLVLDLHLDNLLSDRCTVYIQALPLHLSDRHHHYHLFLPS